MDRFPLMVYRCPGAQSHHGIECDTLIVANEAEEVDAALDGWFFTPADAAEAAAAPVAEPEQQPADDTAPTREELKQKAAELGITHAKNASDAKLAELIAASLSEAASVD